MMAVNSHNCEDDFSLTIEEHHSMLCDLLKEHASKWKEIGQYLGFLPGELDNIQGKPLLLQNAPESWLNKMLERFLNKDFTKSQQISVNSSTMDTALKRTSLGVTANQLKREIQQLQDEKITNEISQTSASPLTCEIHNEPKEIYCIACNLVVCKKCKKLKHDNHKHSLVTDVAFERRVDLRERLQPLKQKRDTLSKAKEALQVTRTDIQEQGELIRKSIDQSFQELHNKLEEHRERLQGEVLRKVHEKLSCLDEQKRDLNRTLVSIDKLETLVEHNVKNSTNENVMVTHQKVVDQIKTEEEQQCKNEDLFTPAAIADMKIDTMSSVKKIRDVWEIDAQIYHTADPLKSIVDGPGLNGVDIETPTHVTVQLILHDETPAKNPEKLFASLKSHVNKTVVPLEIEKQNDTNMYKIQFSSPVRGRHHLAIDINHKEIAGSPFSVFVKVPPSQHDKPMSIIEGVDKPQWITVNSANEVLVACKNGTIVTYTKRTHKMISARRCDSFRGLCITGIATDEDDNIYVTESTNHSLIKLSKGGKRMTIGRDKGQFNYPHGVVVVRDEVFVCDMKNNQVQVFNKIELEFVTTFDCDGPHCITADTQGNNIFVSSYRSPKQNLLKQNTVEVFNISVAGRFQQQNSFSLKFANVPVMLTRAKHLNSSIKPRLNVCFVNEFVYVVECITNRVSVYTRTGEFVTSIGGTGKEGRFDNLSGICTDHDGFVYVCDCGNNRVRVF